MKSAIFIVLLTERMFGQTVSLEPNRSIFQPLLADPKEPRIAVLINRGNEELSLDIGATFDLVQIGFERMQIGIGVDFGTFSELRRAPFFKFPVNAADYIFGISASFNAPLENGRAISGRLRLSHISAHLVDGQYVNGAWLDGLSPFTFSREFLAMLLAVSTEYGRLYAGYEFLFNTIPRNISASSAQAGIEFLSQKLHWKIFYPFLALDIRLVPIWRGNLDRTEGYGGARSVQLGIKTNGAGKRGVRIVYNYFSRVDFRGMYLGRSVSENSLGFLIDF